MAGERAASEVASGATTEGLAVSPGMGPALEAVHIAARPSLMDRRAVLIVALAMFLGIAAGFIAEFLRRLIGLVTNIAFYGRVNTQAISPSGAVGHLGLWVIGIPVVGGLIVGLMARYGSRGIRGHGT